MPSLRTEFLENLTQARFNLVEKIIQNAKRLNIDIGINSPVETGLKEFPLHIAVQSGNVHIVRLLLDNGAIDSANQCDQAKQTPLSLAISRVNKDITDLIVNHPKFTLNKNIGSAILNAVANNDCLQAFHLLERVKTETEKEIVKIALNTWMSEGKFCLHIATENGNPSLMHLLLMYGANPHQKSVHEQKHKGVTAWELARKHQNPAIAELMAKDSCFSLPENFADHIYYEVKKGRIGVVRALLVKAKQENQDNGITSLHDSKDQNNSLHLAVNSGNINMVQLLLEFGAIEAASETNKDKMTPLALSINSKTKTLTITHLLLNHPDFLFTPEISSAILEAVNNDDFYLTERLLKKAKTLFAESLARDVLNQGAKNALYTAVEKSNSRLVTLLMAYGANPHAPNANGDTPLSLAKRLALEDDAKHRTLIKNTPRRETYETILTSPYYLDANSDKRDLDDMDFVAIVAPFHKMFSEHTPLSIEQQADLLQLAPRNRYAKELIADMGLSSNSTENLKQSYAQLAQEDDYANVMHAKLNGNVTEHTLFKAFYLAKTHPLKRHFMKEWINELALDQSSPLQCQAKLLHALLHTNAVAWDAARCMNLEKFKKTVVHLKAFIHLVAIVKTQNEMILDADTLKILEEVASGNTSVNLGIDSTIDQLSITPELKQIMHNIIYAEIIDHERLSDREQKIIFIQQALECFWKAKLPISYSEKLLKKAQVILFGLIHDKQEIDKALLAQVRYALEGLMFVKQNSTPTDLPIHPPISASESNLSFQNMEPPPPYPHKQESAAAAEAQPPPAGKNIETTINANTEESAGQSEASEDKESDLTKAAGSSENTVSEFPLLTAMLKYVDANGVIKEKQKLNEELDALTQLYADKYSLETKKIVNEVESTNTTPPAESKIEKKPVQANPVPIPAPIQQVPPSAGLVSITAHSLFKQSTESAVSSPNATQANAEKLTQAEDLDVSNIYEQLRNLKPIQGDLPIPETTASSENSTSRADEEDSVEENSGDYAKARTRRRAFG